MNERCEKCGALLEKDHGFSSMCETCNPTEIEIVGGVDTVFHASVNVNDINQKEKERLAQEIESRIAENQLVVPKRKRKNVKPFDLGIDIKRSSLEELLAYKEIVDASLISAKSQIVTIKAKGWEQGDKSILLAQLEVLRMEDGKRVQMLAQAIADKKREQKNTKHNRLMAEEGEGILPPERVKFFMLFRKFAWECLPKDLYEQISARAAAEVSLLGVATDDK